jgi:hypothetical protein
MLKPRDRYQQGFVPRAEVASTEQVRMRLGKIRIRSWTGWTFPYRGDVAEEGDGRDPTEIPEDLAVRHIR